MIRAVLALALSLPAIQFAQEQPKQEQSKPQQQQQEQRGPIRAEPTVVTIEGTADRVKTDRSRNDRNLGSKAAGGIKAGAAKTWNGIVRFGGWLLNSGDDIPSDRERQREGEATAKQ